MKIKKVVPTQVPEVFQFVQSAISKMISQGIFQWDEIYPTQKDFLTDAQNNQLYIVEIDEKPAACFTLNKDCDEEYKNGTWSYTGEDYVVIHRLCVNKTVGYADWRKGRFALKEKKM